MKKTDKKKLTIKRPQVNVSKNSALVFIISSVIFGVIIGFFTAALTFDSKNGLIVGVIGGALSGIITNITRKTLLKDVQYPSLKKLAELVVYTVIICIIISLIILALDFVFVNLRDIILKA